MLPSKMKSALILSPFATYPPDAGQRKRAHQSISILKRLGFRITLLFYAFEGPWYYGSDIEALDRMIREWDEVILFPSDTSVGAAPIDGGVHKLDEWWSEGLGDFLRRLFSKRKFDVFVVHNVWLSYAFEICPPSTVKALETHDLFWLRNEFYQSGRAKPEFFIIDKEQELVGLSRADILITIQGYEFDLLTNEGYRGDIINIPYVSRPDPSSVSVRNEYLFTDRVMFGLIASDHAFNVHGIRQLAASLRRKISETFAPIGIVVAGRISHYIEDDLHFRGLGYVSDEDDFYSEVDFALAPVFDGTGFKIKVADSIARGIPILSSTHAAMGTKLPNEYQFETADELADAMVAIAVDRPELAEIRKLYKFAQAELVAEELEASRVFEQLVHNCKRAVIIDPGSAPLETVALSLIFWLNFLSNISNTRVYILESDQTRGLLSSLEHKYTPLDRTDRAIDELEKVLVIDLQAGKNILGAWYLLGSEDPYFVPQSPCFAALPNSRWSLEYMVISRKLSSGYGDKKRYKKIRFLDAKIPTRSGVLADSSVLTVHVDSQGFHEIITFLFLSEGVEVELEWATEADFAAYDTVASIAMERGLRITGQIGGSALADIYQEVVRVDRHARMEAELKVIAAAIKVFFDASGRPSAG